MPIIRCKKCDNSKFIVHFNLNREDFFIECIKCKNTKNIIDTERKLRANRFLI